MTKFELVISIFKDLFCARLFRFFVILSAVKIYINMQSVDIYGS